MDSFQADTAILLFAHTSGQEIACKTFSEQHGSGVNKKIAKTLLQHAVVVAKRAGLPLMPILTDKQVGNTFGERLANAFQEVFAAGYQRVICIGSDCPALSATDLLQAKKELLTANMVVGPATDGGAYLIGLHIDSFNLESFAMLNWQTEELLNELLLYSFRHHACMNCVSFLEEKADVDNSRDLARQLEALPCYHTLKRKLTAILLQADASAFTLRKIHFKPLQHSVRSLLRRAPPAF
ncbi:TIGR04282 family arsenosugar biosynthesis glycosyltransferase [Pontibacter sp. HJ8]